MRLTGAKMRDRKNVWLFYVDADNACGQTGGAALPSIGAFPANDLRGLAGEKGIPTCETDPPDWYARPPCRWVGGMGHELGHALGLPHPPGCEASEPSCDSGSLMWGGVYAYPATYFSATERGALAKSTFIVPAEPRRPLDCNDL
jgi:hypothetical protein